jgi:hypothetical protein
MVKMVRAKPLAQTAHANVRSAPRNAGVQSEQCPGNNIETICCATGQQRSQRSNRINSIG